MYIVDNYQFQLISETSCIIPQSKASSHSKTKDIIIIVTLLVRILSLAYTLPCKALIPPRKNLHACGVSYYKYTATSTLGTDVTISQSAFCSNELIYCSQLWHTFIDNFKHTCNLIDTSLKLMNSILPSHTQM